MEIPETDLTERNLSAALVTLTERVNECEQALRKFSEALSKIQFPQPPEKPSYIYSHPPGSIVKL